jgi:hypothetical protein
MSKLLLAPVLPRTCCRSAAASSSAACVAAASALQPRANIHISCIASFNPKMHTQPHVQQSCTGT